MPGAVEEGAQAQSRRDRHAVVHVAQSLAGDRHIHGHDQRVVAGRRGPVQQIPGLAPVTPQVELKPLARIRRGPGDVLDTDGAHGRQRVGNTGLLGRWDHSELAFGVHDPREAGGRQHEGLRGRLAQDHGLGANRGYVVED